MRKLFIYFYALFLLLPINIVNAQSESFTFGGISYKKAVNTAGKQRMLSQKIAKVVALKEVGLNSPQLKSEFIASTTLFNRNLEILKLNSSKQSPKVRAILNDEINQWNLFKGEIDKPIKDFAVILKLVDDLLKKCHDLVLAIEEESKFSKQLGTVDPKEQLKVKTINKAGKARMMSQKMCLYYVASRIFKEQKKEMNLTKETYASLFKEMDSVVNNDLLKSELNTAKIKDVITRIVSVMDKIKSRKKDFYNNRTSLKEMIIHTNNLTELFNKAANFYGL